MTSVSTSSGVRGRPGERGTFEESNFRATSFRYHLRRVSGRTMVPSSSRAFLPRRLAISARGSAVGVAEAKSALHLGPEDSVFGGEVLVPKQDLLIDLAGDIGQDPSPVHAIPPGNELTSLEANSIAPEKCGRMDKLTLRGSFPVTCGHD